MSGVPVTFVVTSGGGTVAGASVVTDAGGIATVGSWTLGSVGANTLTASAAGLTPVTFTATASSSQCATATAHALGGSSNGDLATTDCQIGGKYVDFYTIAIATAGAYVFTQTSTEIDAFLVLFSPARLPGETSSNNGLIAGNDDTPTSLNSAIKVFLVPGNYMLAATSAFVQTGSYALSSASAPSNIGICEDVFVVPGTTTSQALQIGDCERAGFFSDDIYIFLQNGQRVTITLTSTAFDGRLDLFSGPTTRVATHEDPATGNAQIVYTAPAAGYYLIAATSSIAEAKGTYTLSIQ